MAIYDIFMEPFEKRGLRRLRQKLIGTAKGKVLEVGAGTGLNLPYYNEQEVSSLVLVDQDLNRKALEEKIKAHSNLKISVREENVMDLPFEKEEFDTVVFTLLFCTVRDVEKGLQEIMRVLKKDGKIIFIEHVLPEKEPLKTAFDRATPLWKKLAGGCHLNRETEKSLQAAGFDLDLENKILKKIFLGGTGTIKKTAQ